MQHSVIRRSLLVSAAFIIGHLFHYALMFSANRILNPGGFGRFYTAISLLNILALPATVLSFTLVRHFSMVYTAAGSASLAREVNALMRRHALIGLVLVLLSGLALVLIGSLIGADAFLLLMLVPSTALAFYLFEMARAALQSRLDFHGYSAAWLLWRFGQFVLALAGLLLTGAPWAGMAGIFVATVATVVILLRVIGRNQDMAPAGATAWPPFDVTAAIPFVLQYGLFTLVCNIDVLFAYLLLDNEQLGIYAASSLLPKAIVTATLPVTQVMLPVMSTSIEVRQRVRTALIKALAVTLFLSATAALALVLGRDLACNEQFGIRFCSTRLLSVLALGAIPLSLGRVLVVAGLAFEGSLRIAAPALVLPAFAALLLIWPASPATLANIYAAICWLFASAYALAMYHGRAALRDAPARAQARSNAPTAP